MSSDDEIGPQEGSVKRRGSGQFAPGQSGNRKGRPRKAQGIHEVLRRSMDEKVEANLGKGRKKTISKLEATATQLANKSANGDPRATKMALDFLAKGEDRPPQAAPTAALSGSDIEIVTRFLERMAKIKHNMEMQDDTNDQ